MIRRFKSVSRRDFLKGGGAAALGGLVSSTATHAQAPSQKIVSAKIHPGIGIARIGNSGEYFIGPEVIDPPLTMAGESRDSAGAMKRQAARFRVYGYNENGEVVRELTSHEAKIEWNVHMANKKAAWYRFIVAMDLPEARELKLARRNSKVLDRSQLVIDPGVKSIAGVKQSGVKLDGGKFLSTSISLGELRTDEAGRLLVLSGFGNSGSPDNQPVFNPQDPDTFNNADGWYDDTGDGPVTAKVTLNGELQSLPVESAWVVVAPPNYAPNVIGWRTLYDLLVDTYVAAGQMKLSATSSFSKDILPILRRLSNLQWVNKGIALVHGKGQAIDFENPEFIRQLAEGGKSASEMSLRNQIYNLFRTMSQDVFNRKLFPALYGDAYGFDDKSPHRNFIVNGVIALHLQRWVNGEFINDWSPGERERNRHVESLSPAEQVAMLDRAALHFCLADAFHPGCELTWPMRWMSMYSSPFRIRAREVGEKEPDYGDQLDHQTLFADSKRGPLAAQGPGDLTRWMAIPWQGDTVFCRSGYEPNFDPYILSYWPARVPNHVLTEEDYLKVMDTSLPREKRLEAFNRRDFWVRNLKGSAPEQMLQMMKEFGSMGVIEARLGIPDDQDFPAVIFVESLPRPKEGGLNPPPGKATPAPPPRQDPALSPDPVKRAGWNSPEELEEFNRIRNRRRGN